MNRRYTAEEIALMLETVNDRESLTDLAYCLEQSALIMSLRSASMESLSKISTWRFDPPEGDAGRVMMRIGKLARLEMLIREGN